MLGLKLNHVSKSGHWDLSTAKHNKASTPIPKSEYKFFISDTILGVSGGRTEENASVGSQDISVSNFLSAYLDGCLQDYDYGTVNLSRGGLYSKACVSWENILFFSSEVYKRMDVNPFWTSDTNHMATEI